MRKNIFLLFVFLIASFTSINAQTRDLLVVDAAHAAAITAAAAVDNAAYTEIKENQEKTNQLLVLTDLINTEIKAIEDTTIHYMQQVQSVLRQVYTLEMIVQKTNRVRLNINEMIEMAWGNPELTFVATQMLGTFSDEIVSLTSYISDIALGEGSRNLMSNYERLKIITHVDNKLNKLEGISLQMLYRMKYAKRHGVLQTLFPVLFAYERRNQQIANEILDNFHF